MRRWVAFFLAVPAYVFALMVVGTVVLVLVVAGKVPVEDQVELVELVAECFGEPDWWISAGIAAGVIAALQFVFLIPLIRRRPPREQGSRSLKVSLVVGGLMAALLTMGLGAAAINLVGVLNGDVDLQQMPALWIVPPVMLIAGWVFWSVVLLVFMRGIWADRTLGRLVALLLAGTAVEVLIVLPLDIMVRRRTECYCVTGTFVSLTAAATVVLWLTGPGVLIALLSHRHRRWRAKYCPRCAYPRGPSPGAQCPECGCAWATAER